MEGRKRRKPGTAGAERGQQHEGPGEQAPPPERGGRRGGGQGGFTLAVISGTERRFGTPLTGPALARFKQMSRTETLVIGASAAGLATAAEIRGQGREFEILEAEDFVAASWRRHYDRLHLHTPKRFSALPGLPMPNSWPRYPAREQVVEYLERYQARFAIRPHFGETVQRVERVDGAWETTTSKGTWRSDNVVIATGRARVPVRPTWPGMDHYRGDLLHSSEYRNGDPWKGRPVLVVGFGNSACEQALDLVERGAEVHLSVRSPVNVLPRDIFGVLPVLPLGIVMRRLPTRVADVLAWPMVRSTVGDVRKVGLKKLPYGPNTQMARDHHVPCSTSAPWIRSSKATSRSTATSIASPKTALSSRMAHRPLLPQ